MCVQRRCRRWRSSRDCALSSRAAGRAQEDERHVRKLAPREEAQEARAGAARRGNAVLEWMQARKERQLKRDIVATEALLGNMMKEKDTSTGHAYIIFRRKRSGTTSSSARVPSSRWTRRPPSAAAAHHCLPCHSDGPGCSSSSRAAPPALQSPPPALQRPTRD